MNPTIITDPCQRCQRREAVLNEYAALVAQLEHERDDARTDYRVCLDLLIVALAHVEALTKTRAAVRTAGGVTAIMDAVLTPAEARHLTDQIKQTAGDLWRLLLDAHERQAWSALGYASWREYAKNEFQMGQSHVYRLIDQGRVIRAIEQAAGGSPMGEIVSERVARDLKPQLEAVTEAIEAGIVAGDDPTETVKDVIAKARTTTYLGSRKREDRHNRHVEHIVIHLVAMLDGVEQIQVERIDRDRLPEWAAEIRRAARALNKLAARLVWQDMS